MLMSIEHLSKTYAVKPVLDDVSFAIEERDKIALVGINGTGKTTLLRLLNLSLIHIFTRERAQGADRTADRRGKGCGRHQPCTHAPVMRTTERVCLAVGVLPHAI